MSKKERREKEFVEEREEGSKRREGRKKGWKKEKKKGPEGEKAKGGERTGIQDLVKGSGTPDCHSPAVIYAFLFL